MTATPHASGRFRCPSCGSPIQVPPPDRQAVTCDNCTATLPVRDGIIELTPPASDRDYPHELVDLVAAVEDRHFWFRARTDVILSAVRDVAGRPIRRALDVGCGNGFVMAALERAGFVMSGIDMHRSALVRARTRVTGPLYSSTATSLPFFPDFDLVTLLDVIEHVDDDVSVLAEARQALAAGGHVVVTVPAGPSLWSTYDEVIGHKRRYDRDSLLAVLGRAQLEVRHISYFNYPLVLAAALRRWTARDRQRGAADRIDTVRRALRVPPWPLNTLLRWSVRAEAPLRRMPWMRGGSLIAIARSS